MATAAALAVAVAMGDGGYGQPLMYIVCTFQFIGIQMRTSETQKVFFYSDKKKKKVSDVWNLIENDMHKNDKRRVNDVNIRDTIEGSIQLVDYPSLKMERRMTGLMVTLARLKTDAYCFIFCYSSPTKQHSTCASFKIEGLKSAS